MQDGEKWPGEFEAAAHEAYLLRQRNLARGWHANGWQDPQALVRQLDDQLLDSSHRAGIAKEEQRSAYQDDEVADALAWLRDHPTRNI